MGPEWTKSFDPWFEQFKGDGAVNLGTLGFDFMAPVLFGSVRRSLGERFVLQKRRRYCRVWPSRPKRPRELTMIRASCEVLDAATKTFAESWRKNHEPETAALDAERVARSLAAQDVRTLVSLDGGRTLVPFQGLFEQKRRTAGRLYRGQSWWAIGPTCSSPSMTAPPDLPRDMPRPRSMLSLPAMRPGVRAAELHAKAVDALRPFELHPVLGEQRRPRHRLIAARRTRIRCGGRCSIGGRRRLCIAGRHCRCQSRSCPDFGDRA